MADRSRPASAEPDDTDIVTGACSIMEEEADEDKRDVGNGPPRTRERARPQVRNQSPRNSREYEITARGTTGSPSEPCTCSKAAGEHGSSTVDDGGFGCSASANGVRVTSTWATTNGGFGVCPVGVSPRANSCPQNTKSMRQRVEKDGVW